MVFFYYESSFQSQSLIAKCFFWHIQYSDVVAPDQLANSSSSFNVALDVDAAAVVVQEVVKTVRLWR